MWFSCSSCQRLGGKLDMVKRIKEESACFCLSTGPLTWCQHLKYFCQHIVIATGKETGEAYQWGGVHLVLPRGLLFPVVTHPGPSWRVARDPSAHSPALWGPGVLVSRPASLRFHFYCSYFFFFFLNLEKRNICCWVFGLSGCSASEVDVSLGTGPLFANDAIITYIQALVCRIHVEVIDVLANDSFFDIAPPFVSIQWKLRAVFLSPLLCVYFDSDISLSI